MSSEVPWVVRFVDKPDTDRSVRLDLNDEQAGGNVYVRADGFSPGVGEVEAVTTGSMLTDTGEAITATRRVNREITIPLAVVGESPELAEVLNALARELDRERNYLEFRPSDHTGEAVFFTVLAGSDFTEVDLDPEDYPTEKGVSVILVCEPTGVGLEKSGSFTSNPDPVGTNKPFARLPAIAGDVPAPLTVKVGASMTGPAGPIMVGVCSGLPLLDDPVFTQAEALTAGTGVTLPGNDAAMSGTGSNYARIGFGTNNLDTLRLSGDLPDVPPGRWRVWVRLRNTIAADTFDLRLDIGTLTSGLTGKVRSFKPTDAANSTYWFDLGLVDHPYHQPPDVTDPEPLTVRLFAMRTSGTGSLDVDMLLLVPTDLRGNQPGRVALVTPTDGLGGGNQWILRPDVEMAHPSVPARPAPVAGSHDFRATPGEHTYIHVLRRTYPGVSVLTTNNIIEWSYRPRWQYLSAP